MATSAHKFRALLVLVGCLCGLLIASMWGPPPRAFAGPAAAEGADAASPPAPPEPVPLPDDPPIVGAGADRTVYLPGAGAVTPTGAFTYSIPLEVPAGRAGMEPRLSLEYSSARGNGPLGVGWSLSGSSAIARCGQTWAADSAVSSVRFDQNDDRFCWGGDELILVGARKGSPVVYGGKDTEYRTRTDSFAQIVAGPSSEAGKGPDFFEVRTSDGRILRFDAFSAVPNGSTPERVVWLVRSEKDRFDNEIRYDYDQPAGTSGEFDLKRISYTYGPGREAQRKVEISYTDRADDEFSYQAGVRYDQAKRISAIQMYAPNPAVTQLVWQYKLDYEPAAGRSSRRSVLASVQKCGYLGGCSRMRQFTYQNPDFAPQFTAITMPELGGDSVNPAYPYGLKVMDLNDDGSDDVVYQLGGTNPNVTQFVRFGYPGGLSDRQPLAGQGSAWDPDTLIAGVRPVDIDGDNRLELLTPVRLPSGESGAKVIRWDQATGTFVNVSTGIVVAPELIHEFGDMNGDGRVDYLVDDDQVDFHPYTVTEWPLTEGRNHISIHLNNGAATGQFNPLTRIETDFEGYCGVVMTDLDGDGRSEAVGRKLWEKVWVTTEEDPEDQTPFEQTHRAWVCGDGDGAHTFVLRLNDAGEPVVEPANSAALEALSSPGNALTGDFNGDRLPDALTASNGVYTLRWNTGRGMVDGPVVANLIGGYAPRIGDLNGDGFDDILFPTHPTGSSYAYLSRGDGSFSGQSVSLPTGGPGVDLTSLGDFNGDGRLDVVTIFTATGQTGRMKVALQTPDTTALDRMVRVSDADSTQPRDVVSYSMMWTDHPKDAIKLTAIYPLAATRGGMLVVRSVESQAHVTDQGKLPTRRLEYSYDDPVVDVRDQSSLGFGTFRVFDRQRPSETIYEFAHRKTVDNGKYYPEVGQPSAVTTVTPILTRAQIPLMPTPVQARITRTVTTYTTELLNQGKTYAVFPTGSVTKEWEEPVDIDWSDSLAGSHPATHITAYSEPAGTADGLLRQSRVGGITTAGQVYDEFGNLTESMSSVDGGTVEKVVTSYDNRTGDWLIGLPTRSTVTRIEPDGALTTRTTDTTFDGRGMVSAVQVEKDNADLSARLTTKYDYDPICGTLVRATLSQDGLEDRVSHVEYAPVFPGQPDERVYPSQIWAEYGLPQYRPSKWTAVHPAFGVTVATMDMNKVGTTARFDDLGRPVHRQGDGIAAADVTYQPRSDATGTVGTITTTTVGSLRTRVTTDALGRTIETAVRGLDGTYAPRMIRYDLLGRVANTTGPAPVGTSGSEFDSLDRLVNSSTPDNKLTRYDQEFRRTVATDPLGFQKVADYDLDGRLTSTVDRLVKADPAHPSVTITEDLTTSYTYWPFDLVKTVTDDKNHVTRMEYDARGRRTKLIDPDRGESRSTFFGSGELHTDEHIASGHKTTLGYDQLGRQTYSGSEDGMSVFGYDTAANGIGQIATAENQASKIRTTFKYDAYGRPAGSDLTDQNTGETYPTDVHYDSIGRLHHIQFPPTATGVSRFTQQFDYNNPNGFLDAIRIAKPGSSTLEPLWTLNSRLPNQALEQATLGDGPGRITIKNTYEAATGRLRTLTATKGSSSQNNLTTLYQLTYAYYDNGLVHTRDQDDVTATARHEEFGYDSLSRLTSWILTPTNKDETDTSYTYDEIGNLTGVSSDHGVNETRLYGNPDGSQPHALTSLTANGLTTTYRYDSEGRQESGGIRSQVAYTAFDLPHTIQVGPDITTYLYDAFGQRVKETSRTQGTTIYAGGYEKRTLAGHTTHIFHVEGIDGATAQVVYDGTTTTTQYQLTDGLGSTATVVNGQGQVERSLFYDPFGQRINEDGTTFAGTTGETHSGFTGHEHDDEVGLINMKGRVYDPALKRFLTPDPLVGTTGSAEGWNPYSYVNNSPLNNTDPTGLRPCNDGALLGPHNYGPDDCQQAGRHHRSLFGDAFRADGYLYNASGTNDTYGGDCAPGVSCSTVLAERDRIEAIQAMHRIEEVAAQTNRTSVKSDAAGASKTTAVTVASTANGQTASPSAPAGLTEGACSEESGCYQNQSDTELVAASEAELLVQLGELNRKLTALNAEISRVTAERDRYEDLADQLRPVTIGGYGIATAVLCVLCALIERDAIGYLEFRAELAQTYLSEMSRERWRLKDAIGGVEGQLQTLRSRR